MKKALSLELLPLRLLLSQLREPILPVLSVAAKDALVEGAVLVAQLERVHARALKSVESLRAVTALDRGALRLAAEAWKLLAMHQVLERLADVHPLLPLEAELRVHVQLDAVLVEVEGLADQLRGLLVIVFAERPNKRLIGLLAEGAVPVGGGLRAPILHRAGAISEVVVLIRLCARGLGLGHLLSRPIDLLVKSVGSIGKQLLEVVG